LQRDKNTLTSISHCHIHSLGKRLFNILIPDTLHRAFLGANQKCPYPAGPEDPVGIFSVRLNTEGPAAHPCRPEG